MKKMLCIPAAVCAAAVLAGCYAEIEAEPPSARGGLLPIAGAYNVRDIGIYSRATDGKKIKSGKLIRSGDLNLLTERDKDYLFGTLGVKTVVDFRGKKAGTDGENAVLAERNSSPDRLRDGVNSVWENTAIEESLLIGSYEDIIQNTDTPQQAEQKMIDGYKALLVGESGKNARAQYKEFFLTLLNSTDPVLFHCSAGKDRTGIATMLLLSALGVDRSVIIYDYLLSAENVAEKYYPVPAFIVQSTRQSMKDRRDSPSVQQLAQALNSGNSELVIATKAGIRQSIEAGIKSNIIARIKAGLVDNGMNINQANAMTEVQLNGILQQQGQYLVGEQVQGAISQMGGDGLNARVDAQATQLQSLAAMTDEQIEEYAILAGEKVKPLVTVKASYIRAAFEVIDNLGGVEAYLTDSANGLGLSSAQIQTLKELYLE